MDSPDNFTSPDKNSQHPTAHEVFLNKKAERTYIGRARNPLDSSDEPRKVRILSQVFDLEEFHEFVEINGEVIIRVTPAGRQEIRATFYDDTREVKTLTFQRFFKENGRPKPQSNFKFTVEETERILELFKLIKTFRFKNDDKVTIDNSIDERWPDSKEEKHRYFSENQDEVADFAKNHLTKSDVIALAYRKEQLEIFRALLEEEDYFEDKKNEWKCKGPESVWQKFFEQNPWIFGYGLNFIFASRVDVNKKLEQYTSGHAIYEFGKRVDSLMKTAGLINSLCFVEIKRHDVPLLASTKYRDDCWRISSDLGGSVAQIQKTVQKAVLSIRTKLEPKSDDGSPTGESIFLYEPKSYVVIGSLEQFKTEYGINEEKFGSFELFRRNLTNPEVITFDELYERARFIVEHSANEEPFKSEPLQEEVVEELDEGEPDLSEEDIPF